MHLKTLIRPPLPSLHNPKPNPNTNLHRHPPLPSLCHYRSLRHSFTTSSTLLPHPSPSSWIHGRYCLSTRCAVPGREFPGQSHRDGFNSSPQQESIVVASESFSEAEEDGQASTGFAAAAALSRGEEFAASESIWDRVKEVVMFAGPATALWLCGPLLSLIDTIVIGQGSSIELAALGPATVVCDYTNYVFMFLSIATSNMVATSLASEDKEEVQHQISILLFVGFTCGVLMLIFTRLLGVQTLTSFTGAKNVNIVPAANTYVQIRGLAWPAVLIGMVAQSASLGMKDSWGPLMALAVASSVNAIGAIVLCTFLGYGIAGAAWATMASQVIAAYMMIEGLNKKGYNAFSISIPSSLEVFQIFKLAAPVFITMMSKVAFYSLLIYFATSMGIHTVAAHQVMLQIYTMCTVWGEPLSQTAQSFMPGLIYGINRSLRKARRLLRSLVVIGAITGLILGTIGTSIPWLFPYLFTSDHAITNEMRSVLIPYFIALVVTPSTHSLEGTLLAGRDLNFLSLSMTGCFLLGGLLLLFLCNTGHGLPGCWYALAGFQWARFTLALWRLVSPNGILHSEQHELGKLGAA